MNGKQGGLFGCVTLMAGLVFLSTSIGGGVQAAVLPGWMTATGNGTVDFPSAITAGTHSADSTGTTIGSATFTQNSGSFGNWLMADGGIYESVPSGDPLDMVYGKSRIVDVSVLAADTLRIDSSAGFSATGPNFGQGSDKVTESQFFRITAQSNETILITSSAIISGGATGGSGGSTFISGEGGFYEDDVLLGNFDNQTYDLVAGRVYDIKSLTMFLVNENADGFDGASFGFGGTTTIDIQVIPEPASLSLLAIGGLAALKRRRRS